MTYYGGKDLANAFRTVRNNTLKTAEDIPEDRYDFKPAPDCRSVRQTIAHIALAPRFQHHIHGTKIADLATFNFMEMFQGLMAEEAKPRTKAELIELLRTEGDKFAAFLEALPEPFLGEIVKMSPNAPGPATKSRFEMLLGPKEHEMHHRAQLMTMQRMCGVVPHLTRQMQERFAQMQAQTAQAAR